MKHVTSEHTGLLRMGLEVEASRLFWTQANNLETSRARRARAQAEGWYPDFSEARLRYVLAELERRFPPAARTALRAWRPEQQSALVCHWHLQWSDPLYRDFTSSYLVTAWAMPHHGVGVSDVEGWLFQRRTHLDWSPSTRRRLASGLLGAATEAGFLSGNGRRRELRTVSVDRTSLAYLRAFLAEQENEPAGEEIFLSGTVGTSSDVRPRSYDLAAFSASF